MQDYYVIIEVPTTATLAEIKRSYRRLVRKYHPDLNKQALDEHIKSLNEAYAVLRDPVKRAKYDALRAEEERRKRVQEELRRKQEERVAAQKKQQEQAKREKEMTWVEGMIGFVRELKKGLRGD
jgi:curved DNA-binding protein CbpA